MMKARVGADTCIGCDLCEETCPRALMMVDDKAAVQVEPVPAEAETACQQAENDCPVKALSPE